MSLVEYHDTTPSPDLEEIELKPVTKHSVELKEFNIFRGEPPEEDKVFLDLTLSNSRRNSREATNRDNNADISSDNGSSHAFSDPVDTASDISSPDTDEGFDCVENPLPSFTRILYSKDQVAMFPDKSSKLSGRLNIVEQHSVLFVSWNPHSGNGDPYTIPPIPLSEIRAITRHTPALGWHYVIIVLMSGSNFPPLYFNNGGVRSFLSTLKQHANLIKASNDPNTYLINETPDPLRRSLQSMDLEDLIPGTLGDEDLSFDHSLLSGTIHKLKKLAMGRGTNIFHKQQEVESAKLETPSPKKETTLPVDIPTRESSINLSGGDLSVSTEVGSFELLDVLVSRPTDRFDSLKRQEDWGKEISLSEFRSFFDDEGRLIEKDQFSKRVFYGGLSSDAQPEVFLYFTKARLAFDKGWKYLFGLWNPDWTLEKCEEVSSEKQRRYEELKGQWDTIDSDQERRFAKWRDRKTKIDKDVRRTDRTEHFYRHENGHQLAALRRILCTYVMYNFDLSYCQGMSDLASPVLYVLSRGLSSKDKAGWNRAEAEAFWCFVHLMDRVESNFHIDQRGMHSQLLGLQKLLQLLDPQLYAHFKQNDCLNFFFCFRWILILFKREFSFAKVLRLWESFFSGHRSQHFHLYFCVAILVTHRNTIIREDMDFDELLKFSCDLSGKIDLIPTLKLATVLSAWAEPIEADCLADIF